VIDEGRTGFLVPPGDAGALAVVLRKLLADPALRNAMGATARRYVCDHADTRNCLHQLEAFYKSVGSAQQSPQQAAAPNRVNRPQPAVADAQTVGPNR
jgi:hypothetical protein